jgi:hypothetical protein
MNTVIIIIALVGCFIFGIITGACIIVRDHKGRVIGTLRVDRSDPDEPPYLFLELMNEGYAKLQTQEYVTFQVLRENYIPRE